MGLYAEVPEVEAEFGVPECEGNNPYELADENPEELAEVDCDQEVSPIEIDLEDRILDSENTQSVVYNSQPVQNQQQKGKGRQKIKNQGQYVPSISDLSLIHI